MDPIDIVYKLKKKGCLQKDVADRCKVHPSAVNLVISGKGVSAKIRNEIASIIGEPVDHIWPPVDAVNQ